MGPDHSIVFDVPLDVIQQVKTRFEPRDELFAAKASG